MNIYVSNLDSNLKDEDLKNLFIPYGEVKSAAVAMDAFTDQSRGFGFVEMPDDEEGEKAIAALNNSEQSSRTLNVTIAKPTQVQHGSYRVGNSVVKEYRFRKN